ncbi:DUF3159 domain-containing protein [Hoyosella sp. YIM 151337]|uniref:DUF3159 domain-containing protein n=1 Tax=Hoyosella sp. YIM 151337 TaxID=2992742 RepID=UPI00223577BC|nr:DUF3159 domain-containing protein [Hoyosella sp. YIM 151337]MCW4353290.1 DUF3159 domain-containing protein [Hoyosella sp. YIM 151337]
MWHPRSVFDQQQSRLDQLGGVSGLIQSTVPIVVFIVANTLTGLTAAIWLALAAAAAVLVWRVVRKDPIQPAISGFIGVGICAFIAHRTGEARGFFLFGIYTSLIYGSVFLLSIIVRWPLVGVVWSYLTERGTTWRRNRTALRYYDLATAVWVLVFGARYLVQAHLYDADQTGWLAFARLAMGWPLAAVAFLVCVYAVRRADKAISAAADNESEKTTGGGSIPHTGEHGTRSL